MRLGSFRNVYSLEVFRNSIAISTSKRHSDASNRMGNYHHKIVDMIETLFLTRFSIDFMSMTLHGA